MHELFVQFDMIFVFCLVRRKWLIHLCSTEAFKLVSNFSLRIISSRSEANAITLW